MIPGLYNSIKWALTPSTFPNPVPDKLDKEQKKTIGDLFTLSVSNIFYELPKAIISPSTVSRYAITGAVIGYYTGNPLHMAAAGALAGSSQDVLELVDESIKEIATEITKISGLAFGVFALCNFLPDAWFQAATQPTISTPLPSNPNTSFFKVAEAIANFGDFVVTKISTTFSNLYTETVSKLPNTSNFIPTEITAIGESISQLLPTITLPTNFFSTSIGLGNSSKFITASISALTLNAFIFRSSSSSPFPKLSKALSNASEALPSIAMLAGLFSCVNFIDKNKEDSLLQLSIPIIAIGSLFIHTARNYIKKEKEKPEKELTELEMLKEIHKATAITNQTLLPRKQEILNAKLKKLDKTYKQSNDNLANLDVIEIANIQTLEQRKEILTTMLNNRKDRAEIVRTYYSDLSPEDKKVELNTCRDSNKKTLKEIATIKDQLEKVNRFLLMPGT